MLRFVLLLLLTLPLVACATQSRPAAQPATVAVSAQPIVELVSMTTPAPATGTDLPQPTVTAELNALSQDTGVAPCPRFTSSLDAAERKIQLARPQTYVHML